MPIFSDTATVPIALDDEGNVVHIKAKQNYGDQRALAGALAAVETPGGAPNLAEYLAVLLERNIVSWAGPAFTDAKGNVRPITRDVIDTLDPAAAERIAAEIHTRNPRRPSPLATSASDASSSTPSPTAASSAAAGSTSSSAPATAGPGSSS